MSDRSVKGDLGAGDRVGPYRIDDKLGEGAMGSVYRAERVDDRRVVALKVVRLELAHDPLFRRRFLHEARAATEVAHEHLVDVLDVGEEDGRQYLAMRFVAGTVLEDWIVREGTLPIATTVRLAFELGGALDALHAAGLIHRDVKPSNILIDEQSRAALTDFGLAKGSGYSLLTQPGQIVGTLDYLAPERIRGESATAASDIYALGCVLYECIAGLPPFGAKSMLQVGLAHLSETPADPCAARADAPAGLGAAINAALAKQPSERPAKAIAYAELLQRSIGPD